MGSQTLQGDHTGIHLREKATKACLKTFILLLSYKDTQPEEPIKGRAWIESLELSEALVNSVSQTIVPIRTFRERSVSGTLSLVDLSIAKIRQKPSMQPTSRSSPASHSSLTSTGSPQSSNNGSPQSSSNGSPMSSGTKADSEKRSTTLAAPSTS